MIRRCFLLLILATTPAFATDPAPAPLPPSPISAPVMPINMPPGSPTIIFNYGTYHAASAGSASVPAPSLLSPAAAMDSVPNLHLVERSGLDRGRGFGLRLLPGLDLVNLGFEMEARFFEYLGFELRGYGDLSLPKENYSGAKDYGAYAMAKVQIPFKSRDIDFTPQIGIGYGKWNADGVTAEGLAVHLGAELEVANFLIVNGSLTQSLSQRRPPDYSRFMTGSVADYGGAGTGPIDYTYPVAQTQPGFRAISAGAGVRLDRHLILGLELGMRGTREYSTRRTCSLKVDLRF